MPTTKSKSCRQCGEMFKPRNTLQVVCSPPCALKQAATQRRWMSGNTTKADRKQQRERKESLKSPRELEREAQAAFNRYIRARDHNQPCISCGITYGQFHAGHYRTTKAARQLRFNTYNCHKQCSQCNNHKSGSIDTYRPALINKIGLHKVEWLENNHDTVKWDPDYLRRLKRVFAKRARHIAKMRG